MKRSLPPPLWGLYALDTDNNQRRLVLVMAGDVWDFASLAVPQANGWKIDMARRVKRRDIDRLTYRGVIRNYRSGALRTGGVSLMLADS